MQKRDQLVQAAWKITFLVVNGDDNADGGLNRPDRMRTAPKPAGQHQKQRVADKGVTDDGKRSPEDDFQHIHQAVLYEAILAAVSYEQPVSGTAPDNGQP